MKHLLTRELVTVIAILSVASMAMAILQPVMPLFLTSIGTVPSLIGLLLATGMAGMVFGESSGGWLADRIGIKVPLALGTFLCIPFVLAFTVARGASSLFPVFLFWGVFRSAIFGPGRGYINKAAPLANRATVIAVMMAAQALGRSLATFTGGFIADNWGYSEDFYVSAGISLAAGALVIFGLRGLSFPKNIFSSVAHPVSTPAPNEPVNYRPFTWQCIVTALFVLGGGINSFVPLLATQVIGVDATRVGIVYTVGSLVTVAALIPLGRLSDRRGRKNLMLAALVLSVVAFTALAFTRNWPLLVLVATVNSLTFAIFTPAAVALLSNSVPVHWQGTAMGIYGAAEDIGIIIGLAVGGYAWAAWGPLAFLIVGGSSSLAGAVVCALAVKDKATWKSMPAPTS